MTKLDQIKLAIAQADAEKLAAIRAYKPDQRSTCNCRVADGEPHTPTCKITRAFLRAFRGGTFSRVTKLDLKR